MALGACAQGPLIAAGDAAMSRKDYDTAVASYEAAVRELEATQRQDERLLDAEEKLVQAYANQGRRDDALRLGKRLVADAERILGPDDLKVAYHMYQYASGVRFDYHFDESIEIFKRSLAIRERHLGAHTTVAVTLRDIALTLEWQGKYAEAEATYRRAVAVAEQAQGPWGQLVATALDELASVYVTQGRYADTEPLFRRVIEIRERSSGLNYAVSRSLSGLATLYIAQGRFTEAEPLLVRSLSVESNSDVMVALARLYHRQGRAAEADAQAQRAIEYYGTLSSGFANSDLAQSELAALYRDQARYAEAAALYERALAIREKNYGPEHPRVAESLNELGEVYGALGRRAGAEPMFRRALALREQALGPEHPEVAKVLNNLAALYRAEGKTDAALDTARRSTAMLAGRFTNDGRAAGRGALSEQRTRAAAFEQHIALLVARTAEQPTASAAAAAESFEVAQLARASDTAEQVAKMAARQAAGTQGPAQLARERQDAVARLERLTAEIVSASAKPTAERDRAREVWLRSKEAEARRIIAALDARIEREFPRYRELTSPRPLALAAAQQLLGDHEALLVFLVAGDESYVWAIRHDTAAFVRLAVTRAEIDVTVKRLRAGLDVGAGDAAAIVGRPFDVTAAYAFYRQLIAPVAPTLAGARELLVVPDGALQSLPLGVLVTEPPAKPLDSLADHPNVPWLIKRTAITVLPSVSSLQALRAFAQAAPGSEPFSGFGDPVLEGSPGTARGTVLAALLARGAVADAGEVRKLPPLPETAGELRSIAATLKAPDDALHLGPQATETQVKRLELSRYRTLAFATHGLMAGDFKGLAEPALVLTPPAVGTDLDDGLLTAGEIAELKLNADWVILSACNTAAADGTPGAEGLSGLAKAFFYAGARSLLVSHWSVGSEAAERLTTRMFEETARGAGKAEALQRAMLALMRRTDSPYFAHPALWAPFIVVGEGGNALRR